MTYQAGFIFDEKLASLFQEDTLLSVQYFETFRRKLPLQPEKRLMLAVLEEAISCYQKNAPQKSRREKGLFRETVEWIFEEDGDWTFSFENICEVVGYDPDYIRKGLLLWWREMKSDKPSKAKIYRLNPMKKKHRVWMSGTTLQKAASR